MSSSEESQSQLRSDTSDLVREFNKLASELLSGRTGQSRLFLRIIENYLRQYHLNGMYSAAEILNEAYLRGHRGIVERKLEISNLGGWLQYIALNVIREINRRKSREAHSISTSLIEEFADENNTNQLAQLLENEDRAVSIHELTEALSHLSSIDKEIIVMRLIEEASWQRIAQELGGASVAAYRKRGSRALSRLREAYMTIHNT